MSSVCGICCKNIYKYQCPNCNILYCSIHCYKDQSHRQCSETFFKRCITEEIKAGSHPADLKLNSKIFSSLNGEEGVHNFKSFHQEQGTSSESDSDDDFEDETDLFNRMENVNLDDYEAVWNKLNEAEKLEFQAQIHNNDCKHLLEYFIPWWETALTKRQLVEIIDEEKKIEDPSKIPSIAMPSILENIKDFTAISSKAPSDTLRLDLINIIGAYTCIVRNFCGDHHIFCNEASSKLVDICSVLRNNSVFKSEDVAIESIVHDAQTSAALEISFEGIEIIRKDIHTILESNFKVGLNKSSCILMALSDIHKLFSSAKACDKKAVKKKDITKHRVESFEHKQPTVLKKKLSLSIKKIEYFLAYGKTFL